MPVTFDAVTRTIQPNGPVDGNGRISIGVQADLYSFGKREWLDTSSLHRFRFPIEAIGGQETSLGRLGTTYVLLYGWRIDPTMAFGTYELQINGNVITADGSTVAIPTSGVNVTQNLSVLVEVVQALDASLVIDDLERIKANTALIPGLM